MSRQITQCPQCKQPIAFYDSILGDYPTVLECPTCGWKREDSKQWGGPGRGQGKKSTWQSGPTKPIKVPIALADEVMQYARALDRGELPGRSPLPFASIGDVLESLPTVATSPPPPPAAATNPNLEEAIALLGEALGLKANAGGAIKTKIREALQLLS